MVLPAHRSPHSHPASSHVHSLRPSRVRHTSSAPVLARACLNHLPSVCLLRSSLMIATASQILLVPSRAFSDPRRWRRCYRHPTRIQLVDRRRRFQGLGLLWMGGAPRLPAEPHPPLGQCRRGDVPHAASRLVTRALSLLRSHVRRKPASQWPHPRAHASVCPTLPHHAWPGEPSPSQGEVPSPAPGMPWSPGTSRT